MANKFREKNIEEVVEEPVRAETRPTAPPRKPGRKGVVARGLSSVFSGTFLASDRYLNYIPFLLFLTALSIFYIGYNYYADDNVRREIRLNKEIKEYHTEYILTTSDLMFATKQSVLAGSAEALGLKESIVPLVKLKVDSTELYGRRSKQ